MFSLMLIRIPLPDGTKMSLQYSKSVYNPHYSSYRDTIGLADQCLAEVKPTRFIDVACGAGVIGLAIKKLHPLIDVYLSDKDPAAVAQTKQNAKRLGLDVTVLQTDLLPKTQFYPVVAANLPTYTPKQLKEHPQHSPLSTLRGEGADGLGLYRKLMEQMKTGSFLICEVQDAHQADFYSLLAESQVWQVVATSKMGFALFKRPVPEYADQLAKAPPKIARLGD